MKEYILSSCASIVSIYFILNNNYIKNLFDFKKTQPKQILNDIQENSNSSQTQQTTEMKIQSPTNIENTIKVPKINNMNLSSSSELGSLCMDTLSDTSLLSEPSSAIEKNKTQKITTPIVENKPPIQQTKTYTIDNYINIDTKNIKDKKDKKDKKEKRKKKNKEDKNNPIEYVPSPNNLINRTYKTPHL
tara:strand:+ start:2378 stop:2944 length:567 start_codon:yes stop_codon:yes gene_type:complete